MSICVVVSYKTELAILKKDLTCRPAVVAAVVGDSRVETVFDPEEIPWLANFGKGGASFSITAQRARIVALCNPNLRFMMIDVNPSRFFRESLSVPLAKQNPWDTDGASLIEVMTRKDMPPIGDDLEVRFLHGVLLPGLRNWFAKFRGKAMDNSPIAGGFRPNTHVMSEDKAFFVREKLDASSICGDGETILRNLISDLRDLDVTVALCSMPIYEYDKQGLFTDEVKEEFACKMRTIAAEYGIKWFNWLGSGPDDPRLWCDNCHLNDKGAKMFCRAKRIELEQFLTFDCDKIRTRKQGRCNACEH